MDLHNDEPDRNPGRQPLACHGYPACKFSSTVHNRKATSDQMCKRLTNIFSRHILVYILFVLFLVLNFGFFFCFCLHCRFLWCLFWILLEHIKGGHGHTTMTGAFGLYHKSCQHGKVEPFLLQLNPFVRGDLLDRYEFFPICPINNARVG